MLEDDRKKYAMGTPEEKPEEKLLGHIEEVTDELREKLLENDRKTKDFVIKEYGIDPDGLEMEIKNLQERDQKLTGGQIKLDANKDGKISGQDFELLRKAEGGNVDGQMLDRQLKVESNILANRIFGLIKLAPQFKTIHFVFILKVGKG